MAIDHGQWTKEMPGNLQVILEDSPGYLNFFFGLFILPARNRASDARSLLLTIFQSELVVMTSFQSMFKSSGVGTSLFGAEPESSAYSEYLKGH